MSTNPLPDALPMTKHEETVLRDKLLSRLKRVWQGCGQRTELFEPDGGIGPSILCGQSERFGRLCFACEQRVHTVLTQVVGLIHDAPLETRVTAPVSVPTPETLVDATKDQEFVDNQTTLWGWDGEHTEDAVGYACMYREALVTLGVLKQINYSKIPPETGS